MAVVLSLVKACPDDDVRSCQSEPAILRDLEDSYGSLGTDLVQDITTPVSSHRWSADNLSAQDLADMVHPPRVAPEVTMSDAAAEDLQCKRFQAPHVQRDTANVKNSIPHRQVPLELKEQVGSGDCTPVVCPSPPMECRRFGSRMLRSGCVMVQGGLPLARVQTAPELTSTRSHAPLPSCTEQMVSEVSTYGEVTSLPQTRSKALTSDSSPLSSPEHTPCSPWIPDTPLSVLTSPLPPKNFRFSLELSAERHRPLEEVTGPLHSVNERLGSVSSDYGSGDIGSHSHNGTPVFHDDMRLHILSLDARLKSHSTPSVKLTKAQSTNYSLPLRSWSSDSSRSSISSFKSFDIRLRKNGIFSSTPNLHSACLQTST